MSPTPLSSTVSSSTALSSTAPLDAVPPEKAPSDAASSTSRSSLRRSPVLAAVLLAVLALVAALPAAADWLVTRDGGRMETKGEWEVKGRLVVFTTADGQLSSLRLDDVDLEASREATETAARAAQEEKADPETEEEEPQPARRKITDADIPPGKSTGRPPRVAAPEDPSGADAAAAEDLPEGPPATNLVVVFSEGEAADDGHTLVRGRLANRGAGPAVGVRLTVHLYGFEGETLGSAPAQLESTALQSGQEADFVADFPEVYNYAAMSFEPRGTSLANTPSADAEEEEIGEVDG